MLAISKINLYLKRQDTIAAYTASDGEEYLVTANEGDDKEYIWGDDDESVWTEMTRGEDLAGKLASDADTTVTNDDLNNTAALGRIKIGKLDVTLLYAHYLSFRHGIKLVLEN